MKYLFFFTAVAILFASQVGSASENKLFFPHVKLIRACLDKNSQMPQWARKGFTELIAKEFAHQGVSKLGMRVQLCLVMHHVKNNGKNFYLATDQDKREMLAVLSNQKARWKCIDYFSALLQECAATHGKEQGLPVGAHISILHTITLDKPVSNKVHLKNQLSIL